MADGPWDLPPATPPPPAQRLRVANPRGLVIWLGLLGAAALLLVVLMTVFPGQASQLDLTQAAMLIGWLGLASSGLLYSRRYRAGQVIRNLAIWATAVGVIVTVYTFRGDIVAGANRVLAEIAPGYAVANADHEIAVRAAGDGHFYVMGQVNGAPVRFVVDTGASDVVLNRQDAARAGVDVNALKFNAAGETANGVGYNAAYTIPQLEVGPIHMGSVAGSVNGAPLSTSLLGMTFLSRLQSFEFKGDTLIMRWKG